MRPSLILLAASLLLFTSCKNEEKPVETKVSHPEFFIGISTDKEWPYRYTLIRNQGQWAGEIEIVVDDYAIFFDKMKMISSSDQKLTFVASYGGIGKALPMEWELSLSRSGNNFDGVLLAKGFEEDFEPIHLKLVATENAILPSSLLDDKIREMDDTGYRTVQALDYEVAIAKREWEKEEIIAKRIRELRSDDTMRGGIRKEWVGPAWVSDRVNEDDSKYFERICCVYVGGSTVTDLDVQAISDLTELRELFLHRTEISNAALKNIGRLEKLRSLHLGFTAISDEGLENFKSLTNLKEVYLNETNVTDDGVSKLRSFLPTTDIQW